jgi:uncharacterized membrane protein YphA (DoxX/SURF4 family)
MSALESKAGVRAARPARAILRASQAKWLIRLLLAAPFAVSGLVKLTNYSAAVAEFDLLNIWAPEAAVALTILTQLGGSALLLGPRYSWVGACLLAAFTGLATLIAHPFWLFPARDQAGQMITFLEHGALAAGLVAAAILLQARKVSYEITDRGK